MENIEMSNAVITAIEEPVLTEAEVTTTVPEIPEVPDANVDAVNVTPEPATVWKPDITGIMMAIIGASTVMLGAGYLAYVGCKWGKGKHETNKAKRAAKKEAKRAKKEAKRQAKIVKIEPVPEQNSSDEENFEEVDD